MQFRNYFFYINQWAQLLNISDKRKSYYAETLQLSERLGLVADMRSCTAVVSITRFRNVHRFSLVTVGRKFATEDMELDIADDSILGV